MNTAIILVLHVVEQKPRGFSSVPQYNSALQRQTYNLKLDLSDSTAPMLNPALSI